MSIELLWEIKRPSSTKEIKDVGIFSFFNWFSKMNIKGERYRADNIGESAEPWPTPTLILNISEKRLFYE